MKSREMARSWLPRTAVGRGGGGAAVDSEEMNEEENGKNWGGGEDTFPGISVRGGDPLVASGA